jgi:hypothetical protein
MQHVPNSIVCMSEQHVSRCDMFKEDLAGTYTPTAHTHAVLGAVGAPHSTHTSATHTSWQSSSWKNRLRRLLPRRLVLTLLPRASGPSSAAASPPSVAGAAAAPLLGAVAGMQAA